jgi:hypothetical protein
MHREVQRHKDRLDALFSKVEQIEDLELQARWAEFLCVRASGFIEYAVRRILISYCEDRANPQVFNYASWHLERFTNPSADKIVDLTRRFSTTWAEQLERDIQEIRGLKAALNSIVADRHEIAHGRDTRLSYSRIKGYYDTAVQVVDLLEGVCAP